MFINGLESSSLGMVSAVGREPCKADWSAFADSFYLYIPNTSCRVTSMGMIDPVHFNRIRIMIDGDIDASLERELDAETNPAAAGEVVDNQRL